LDIYKSLTAGVSLLSNPNSDYLLSYFLNNLIPECVDYENGTCDFAIPAMREFLELLKMMPDSQEVIYDDNINFEKAQGDELYLVIAPIYDFKFYNLYTKKPFMPNDTNVVGFPTADGGKRGDYIRSQGFTILNSSDKKDGAWEFIKYSLSEEFYKNEYHINLILAARSGIKYQIFQTTSDRNYIYINTKDIQGTYLQMTINSILKKSMGRAYYIILKFW
jgi:ABC-type glycerol-3-phosphate transport system substrate-binding protein